MPASAIVTPTVLRVDPGGEAACSLRVGNSGTVVDEFGIEVLGDAARWATLEPPTLRLFPGADGTVRVAFTPPRTATSLAQVYPFALRVTSGVDPAQSVVEEGSLEVTPFHDLSAELLPKTSHGRRAARHELAVDNRGNTTAIVSFAASDSENAVEFAFTPPSISGAAGTATFVGLRVRPRTSFWKGPAKTRPFQAVATSRDAPPVTLDGSMLQEPLLPAWLPKALVALLALLVAALVLWLALLQPTIKSEATNAAQSAVAQALNPTPATSAGGGAAGGGGAGGTPAAATPGGGLGTTGRGPSASVYGDPQDGRLTVTAAPGGSSTPSPPGSAYTVLPKRTFALTDIFLENPQGDTGTLEILRNGQVIVLEQLSNFRDLDFHFISPVIFKAGDQLQLKVSGCQPGGTPPSGSCSDDLFYTGFIAIAP